MASSTRYSQLRKALLHPVWLGALATLAINDHLLKGSGLLPGWLTGKLSDVVGLFAAPLLLAVLLRVRSRRGWLWAHIAIAIVFAGIQLSAAFADLWSSAMGMVGFPWVITRDVTDLLALPALAASFVFIPRWAAATTKRAAAGEVVVAAGGLVCCVATSPPGGEPFFPNFDADTYLHNANDFEIVVRVRPLEPDASIDCNLIEEQPGLYLSEPLFGDAQSWTLQPDATMPLLDLRDTADNCYAVMVDADNLQPVIVFWRVGQIPTSWVEGQGITADAPGWISIDFDSEGRGSYENELDIVFPLEDPLPRPDGVCLPSDDSTRLAWGDVNNGQWRLAGIDEGIDGCVQMLLRTGFEAENDEGGTSWTLCLPAGAFPFADGDAVDLTATSFADGADGIEMRTVEPSTGTPIEGGATLSMARGSTVSNLLGMQAVSTPQFDCAPVVDETCGTVRTAASVSVSGGGFEGTTISGQSEGPTRVRGEGQEIEIYLVHASEQYAVDPGCEGQHARLGADLEMVAVRRALGGE